MSKALKASELCGSGMQILRRVVEAVWAKFVFTRRLSIPNVDYLKAANRTPVIEGSEHLYRFGWY